MTIRRFWKASSSIDGENQRCTKGYMLVHASQKNSERRYTVGMNHSGEGGVDKKTVGPEPKLDNDEGDYV